MGKSEAKKRADAGTISIGELRKLISAKRGKGGMSKLNPSLTLEQVLDIFDGALAGRSADDVPPMFRSDPYSRVGRMKPTRDHLTFCNILRECA